MQTLRNRHFLTLVLLSASTLLAASVIELGLPSLTYAALTRPSPDFEETPAEQENQVVDEDLKKQSVDVTPPPPGPLQTLEVATYFHSHRQALTVRLASIVTNQTLASDNNTDETEALAILGVQYMFSLRNLSVYEAGADWHSDGTGAMHLLRRFTYSRSTYRPYLKLGLGVRAVPSDRLLTFVRLRNYQIRGGAGLETQLTDHFSLRVEAEASASTETLQGVVGVGGSWSW